MHKLATLALALGLSVSTAGAGEALDDPKLASAPQVSPLSGRLNLTLEDLRVSPETPWPFSVRRTYLPGWGDPQNLGRAWVSLFDSRLVPFKDGFLLLDPSGSLRSFARDGAGWATTHGKPARLEREPAGFRVTAVGQDLRFDAEGRLALIAGSPRALELERDSAGRVTRLTGPFGELRLERDPAGLLQAIASPCGLRVDYTHDEQRQLVVATRLGVQQRFAYDAEGRLNALAGDLVQIAYDDAGRVAKLAVRGLVPTAFAYATDAETGDVIGTVTHGDRVLTRRTSPDLRRIELRHGDRVAITELDARGRVVREVTNGQAQTRSYDAQGRTVTQGETQLTYADPQATAPSRVSSPQGTVYMTYEGGLLTSSRSTLGVQRWVYDELGRVVKSVTPDGAQVELGYDARNRRISSRLTQGARVVEERVERAEGVFGKTVGHDGKTGRTRTVERREDGTVLCTDRDPSGRVLRTAQLDALGRTHSRTSARGVTRTIEFDALGRWTSVAGAHGTRLQASYDAWGMLNGFSDGNGNTASFSHDGEWSTFDEPSWGPRSSRIADGQRADRRGSAEISTRYNERGQLVSRTLPEGEERFHYDAEGRLIKALGPQGGLRYAYDAAGRTTAISVEGTELGVTYSYTAAGRLDRATYPWGSAQHSYDDAGRLSALDLGKLGTVRFGYDSLGRRVRIDFPSGVHTAYRYDGDRVVEIATLRGEELLERRGYTYDAQGRMQAAADVSGEVRFTHDAEGQLLSAAGSGLERSYTYDAMGNRTGVSKEGSASSFDVTAGNRIDPAGEPAFAYGEQGALVAKGQASYRYDSLNRLVAAVSANGDEVRYGYAPDGTRLWREDKQGRTFLVPGAAGPVAEVRADGELEVGYLHGQGLDDVVGAVHNGAFFAAHTDCVKSVTALTDAQGEVAARYRYTPFGETLEASGAEWNRLRFTGRPLDAASGLYDVRARTYDPELGRFTSPDPAGYRGGANLYAYVLNDPTVLRDPLGLFPGFDIPGPFDEFVEDAVDTVGDVGGDLIDLGSDTVGDVVDAGGDFVGDVAGVADTVWDAGFEAGRWGLFTGPLGVDHNPFFFGPVLNPFALEETLAFGQGFLGATWGTVTSPYHLATQLWNDPLGTLQTLGQLGNFIANPGLTILMAQGDDDHALNHLQSSVLEGLGNYWDAFLNDPEEFWRRNGEIAPIVVGAVVTGGESAALTTVLQINEVLSNIGHVVTVIDAASPDEQGAFSSSTIPGASFPEAGSLSFALTVAAASELEVTGSPGNYVYSSPLLEETFTTFGEYLQAALELEEVMEALQAEAEAENE